ncbi:MAG TPA: type II toxin-antitoxin system VapB family antitoxin [Verrucomicrobiota bacterium]|nr:type II toxin-antitoxin system VapB family antitoxin [Verrucomicrobiota bacterium]
MSRYSLVVPTNLKLDDKMIAEAVKLGQFRTKQEAVNAALAEFVARRNRLRILELAGQMQFDPGWDYKQMRRRA